MGNHLIYKNEAYYIIGLCMNVYNELGKSFNEIIYAEALEIELKENGVPNLREKKYPVYYKGIKLNKHYYADFVLDNKIILELKAIERLTSSHTKQVLNYLAVSKLKLGLLVNFGEDSLNYKRIVL
ncbi:NADH:ubiquinone oxidoreductase [Sediminicola luteus]|uniref:NADH:ubiquinone oxidoreductase n=2 Tax=Sediminicola luteus TaxID=319238 RepID=A0A2A4G6J2_9FLAO|nr:NADH:ubiquinone oxidoreductase [Sediminicola luteus]